MIDVLFKKVRWCVGYVGLVGLAMFLLSPVCVSAATLQRPPNNLGLVGYWAFNEGTSTRVIDQSGNGNNGSVSNPIWAPGKLSQALFFDGTGGQVVTIPDSSSLNQTGSFSVSLWVYIADGVNRGFFEKTVGGNVNTQFLLFTESNRFQFRVMTSSMQTISSDDVVPLNTWVHIVGTFDGSIMRMYVNGVLQNNTRAVTGQIAGGSGVTLIGTLGSGVYRMQGKIDEVRMYNRALSQSDVTALHKSGQVTLRKISQEGLLAHWAFNERFPSVQVADSSGNRNTGTVRNSANTWGSGARGGALVFDGNNDYVDVVSTSALKYTGGNLSIAFWMRPASDESDGGRIVSKPWSGCGDYNYTVEYGSAQGVAFTLKGATGASLSSARTAPRDQWTHVVATVDSSRVMRLYINGVFDNNTTHSITNWTPPGCGDTNTPLTLGSLFPYSEGWAGNTGFSFKGALDDVRMYSRVLSAAEVATMYRQNETTLGASQASRGVTSGLQWSYGFDSKEVGTTSVTDMSGNGKTGWFFGGTRPGIGRIGQGLIMNGTDGYVDTPSFSFLGDANGSFTITLWIKPRVTTGTIIHNRNDASGWSTGLIGYVSNKINVIIYPNGNLASPNTSVAGEWKYVSLTRDGATGTNKLYENGVEVASSVNAYSASGGNNKFTIGRYFADCCTFGSWFDGTVDEARLYNRALSAAEIKQLYNMGK